MDSTTRPTTERRDLASEANSGGSLRQQAYNSIREQIFEGGFPAGTLLSEYKLAEALGISRTPVREAMKQLAEAGLVYFVPKRGAFVSELSVRDIMEVYQIRQELESFATRVAAEEFSDEEIDELRQETTQAKKFAAQGRRRDAFEAAMATHQRIVSAPRNRRLEQIIAQMGDQVRRLNHLTFQVQGRLEEALDEHEEIVEALGRRDGELAAQAMRKHLQFDREAAVRQALPYG